jgi:hypothetical protein
MTARVGTASSPQLAGSVPVYDKHCNVNVNGKRVAYEGVHTLQRSRRCYYVAKELHSAQHVSLATSVSMHATQGTKLPKKPHLNQSSSSCYPIKP